MIIDIQAEIAAGRELIAKLPAVIDSALIGSATYRPDPHDVDFAILIDPSHNAVDYCTVLVNDGWGSCGDYDGVGGIWAAVRRENLNLMVSHDPVFFDRYKVAMEVCKALRLEHKEDRVAVCAIVRDGKTAEQVRTYGMHLSAVAPDPSLIELFGDLRGELKLNRRTVPQLFEAADRDTDAVSVFMDGTEPSDTERAILVVKGPENVAYLTELCKRQGLLTADKPVEA